MCREVMVRATWLTIVVVLLPGQAAAQKALFVEGLHELARTMLASGDSARTQGAIDTMAVALDGWETQPDSAGGAALLGDESATNPVLPLAAYADGFVHLLRGDYRAAVASLRRAAHSAIDERPQLAAAGRLAQQGRFLDAERQLRAILTDHPESGLAHWWLGRIYENLYRIADARRAYESAVDMALTGRATLYLAIGRLAHAEGDFARAAGAFERRLRLTPDDSVAHKDLAWVLLDQDRTELALDRLARVVAITPGDYEAHAAIGRIHLEAGLHRDAIVALRRALALRPSLHEARYALAHALRQSGREDEAAREMELFERARRESTEDRRRTMAAEAQRQEGARLDRQR